MHWQRFVKFVAHNLNLSPCLQILAPPARRGMGFYNPTFESWVEQQVDYIAVRPLESLDMTATDTENDGTNVMYSVCHHIENKEHPCAHARYLYSHDPGTTVQQLIDGLVAWHRPLVIDVIVRHTTKRRSNTERYHESVEFFLVRDNAQPQ
jgi:hypothetical protein